MNGINQIIIEGRCVNDTEISESEAKVKLAAERTYKDSDGEFITETSYFDVYGYGILARYMKEQCFKGRNIRVVGRLRQKVIVSEKSSVSQTVIQAEHIEFMPNFNTAK